MEATNFEYLIGYNYALLNLNNQVSFKEFTNHWQDNNFFNELLFITMS